MAHILIAEDEASIRDLILHALQTAGHKCDVVEDGGQAINALIANKYDLLLSDISMPIMDGIALALQAGSLYPNLRIILTSGYNTEQQRAQNLNILVNAIVPKPFTLSELTAAVEDALINV